MKADFKSSLMVIVVACATVLYALKAPASPSVVGLWRFNEGSGTNALDSSGLGNNGTLVGENGNDPVWAATNQFGSGGALLFTNDYTDHAYVNIPAANSLMIGQTATNAWTIMCWAFESSDGTGNFLANYGRMLTIDDGSAFQWESGTSGDAEMYTWSEITAGWQVGWGVGTSVAPLLDQWVHWAVVYDGTNLTVYRNANQGPNGGISSTPVTSAMAYSGYTGAVIIGSELDQAGSANWNGLLSDVAIFNGALTQAQIATAMSGNFSSFIGGPVNFIWQPQSVSAPQGTIATFSVGTAGQTPLQYQWYFNGAKLSSASNPTATNATLVLTNIQFTQSGVYTVAVSNSLGGAISPPATLFVFNQPLVGLWRFDEGSGTTAHDSSGLGNDGVLAGENGNVPAWVAGQSGFGGALYFTNNGADHTYVAVPSSGSLLIGQTATNPWSITAWAYENSDGTGSFVATYGRILVIDDGTAFQFESGAAGDDEMYTWARASGAWQLGWGGFPTVLPLLDEWVHWAVVYDGANLTVYRNGNQGPNGGIASQAASSYLVGYPGFSDAILIGSELAQTGDRTWNGKLDDVAVFNIALSQAQVQTVMAGNFSPFIAPSPRLAIGLSAGNAVLSWPVSQFTYQLQSTTNLAPTAWGNVTNSPVLNGGTVTVTLPVGSRPQFFRLLGP